MDETHKIFTRLVGRVLGVLDVARADDNLKQTVKTYIWQAESDVKNKGENNVGNKKRD